MGSLVVIPLMGFLGILFILIAILMPKVLAVTSLILGIIWLISPSIMYSISKKEKQKNPVETLNSKDKEYVFVVHNSYESFKKFLNQYNFSEECKGDYSILKGGKECGTKYTD